MSGSSELRVGETFAGYRVEAEAGHGGMGVVYRATHLRLERTVALKLIAPALASDPAFVARFEREWRMLAALEHPNVIGVYEAGDVDGQLYLAMRWVPGGDLAARLRGTAGLDARIAIMLLSQVAAALDAAHERGVVHRDVKPANVLLDGDHAWLTDFGAGKDLGARDTRTAPGRWVGTADYVAPELLDGTEATPAADVYSLGCVLFEALTGRVPFPRDTELATLWAHRYEPPPSTTDERPGLPRALDGVLRRMLAKEPAERPASAGEALRAARAAVLAPPPGAATVVAAVPPQAGTPPSQADTPSPLADVLSPPADAASPRADRSPPPARTPRAAAESDASAPPHRRTIDTVNDSVDPVNDSRERGVRVRPSRHRALLAAGALLVAGAGIALGLVLADEGEQARTARPPALAPFVERIALGEGANAGRVAANPTFAYVADGPNREIIQVLSSSRQVVRRIKLRSPPHDLGLTTDGKHLWVTLEDRQLVDIDLETRERTYVKLDIEGRYVAVTNEDVVVLSPDGDGRLQRVDPATHRTVGEPYHLGGAPTDLDAIGDRVAEVTALPPQLHRFPPELGKPQTIDIEADGVPAELLVSGLDGWITDSLYDEVIRFDATTGKALNKVKVASKPDGIAEGDDVIWVATRSGIVERLDAKTAKRLETIDTKGPLSGDIAVSGGVAWAPGADDLVRIEPRS